MYLIVSIIIGAIISVMILFNGTISNTMGLFTSSVIIHFVGLISTILILIIRKSKFIINREFPFFLYIAGAIGVITVMLTNITFVQLGVSLTISLGLLGQSVFSILIDNFGYLGMKRIKFNRKKYIGLFLIAFGIFIMTIY